MQAEHNSKLYLRIVEAQPILSKDKQYFPFHKILRLITVSACHRAIGNRVIDISEIGLASQSAAMKKKFHRDGGNSSW